MKIIIVGLGKVGEILTESLAKENHDLFVVDLDRDKINDVVNQYDVNGICGNGATADILGQCDASHTDMIISVTSEDELNILVAMVGKKLGVKHAIARVRNPDYSKYGSFYTEQFGLNMIVNPEAETANEILRLITFSNASSIETFAKGKIELVGIKMTEDSDLNGHALRELRKITRTNILICAVRRGSEIIIPSGNFVIEANDELYITGAHYDISCFCYDIGLVRRHIKSVTIAGGSRIAYYLASLLEKQNIAVKIIEKNHDRCLDLSQRLPKAIIISGDASDEDLLIEEGIEKTDAFVCLTGMDEENIVLSLLAKQLNVKKAIAKVNSSVMANMIDKLPIDSIVSPKHIIANQIIGYVRAKSHENESDAVQTMYRLVDDQVEALEFVASSISEYYGIPLQQLPIKKGVLVAAILRNGVLTVPKGNTTIEKDDHIMIVAKNSKIERLSDIFED